MASEINREELRNALPDMDEMRKLLINESGNYSAGRDSFTL